MNNCMTCGNPIPSKIKTEESTIITRKNRKNCFDCVPRQIRESKFETVDVKKEKDRERWRIYHKQRRKDITNRALDYKGGKCMICNYSRCSRALEFHHIDPKTKLFGISYNGVYRTWEEIKNELDKCALLCANCHREIEDGLITL